MQPANGSVNEETFYFALNDRRCRSCGISATLFSHLADNGPVRSTGPSLAVGESAIRFPEARVSTCDNCIDVSNSKGAFSERESAAPRPKVLLEKFEQLRGGDFLSGRAI